jgi:hypothetical protein
MVVHGAGMPAAGVVAHPAAWPARARRAVLADAVGMPAVGVVMAVVAVAVTMLGGGAAGDGVGAAHRVNRTSGLILSLFFFFWGAFLM